MEKANVVWTQKCVLPSLPFILAVSDFRVCVCVFRETPTK